MFAVAACDVNDVSDGYTPQKAEMCVTVRGIYGNPALAGVSRLGDMAGPEGKRLAAGAFQNDGAGADPLHLDPRYRPRVGP